MLTDVSGESPPPPKTTPSVPASAPIISSRLRIALDVMGGLAMLGLAIQFVTFICGYAAPVYHLPGRVETVETWLDKSHPTWRDEVKKPGPKPGPTPAPTPPVAPVTGPFRAVFLFESSANLTQGQLDVLNSTAIRSYLTDHCEKDADGRAAWRFWDQNVDVSRETPSWQKAMADAKGQAPPLPRVVVTRNGKVASAPLPATEADTLAYLKTFGG